MANLLRHMAERAIGVRPVAMPVLRPMFAAQERLEEQMTNRFAPTELERPAVRHGERFVPPSPPETRQTQERDSSPSLAVKAQRPAPTQTVEHRTQAGPVPLREQNGPPTKPTLKEVIEHIYQPREHHRENPRESSAPAVVANPEGPASGRTDNVHAGRRKPEEAVEPRLVRTPPQRANSQPSREIADRPQRPSMEARPQPVKLQVGALPPTNEVHVSIGRIELKAAPQPPAALPPRQETSRRAHLSLDEYLEHRRGGRR
jgi:hypothetical protein